MGRYLIEARKIPNSNKKRYTLLRLAKPKGSLGLLFGSWICIATTDNFSVKQGWLEKHEDIKEEDVL